MLEQAETQTGCVTSMMATLRERLQEVLPDFGVHLGYDGKALAIMMALALGHVLEGRPSQMRSLVGEVPFRDTG